MSSSSGRRKGILPTPRALWSLRVLALAGLLVGLFLLSLGVVDALADKFIDSPYCTWASWMDCDAVLFNNPQWSKWLGIPVAAPAVLIYLAVAVVLFLFNRSRDQSFLVRGWWVMYASAVCLCAAAAWMIYLQIFQIGAACTYCLTEHVIGLLLAVLIWWFGRGLVFNPRHIRWSAAAAGLGATAMLVLGQVLHEPDYVEVDSGVDEPVAANSYSPSVSDPEPTSATLPVKPVATSSGTSKVSLKLPATWPFEPAVIVGTPDRSGGWVEEGDASDQVALRVKGKNIKLHRTTHPIIGKPDAPYVAVEVVDYTCPRCRKIYQALTEAKLTLGEKYAVMVITWPLEKRCNRYVPINDKHKHACSLAKLAHAVWLNRPEKFAEFHGWLFDNQEKLKEAPSDARGKAARLIGWSALDKSLGDGRVSRLLARDVQLGMTLKVKGLPGLYAHASRFTKVPDDPEKLIEFLHNAFEK